MKFDNYNVLITGAASGIGLETSRQFIAQGATVFGVDINEAGLQSARAELGDRFIAYTCNLLDTEQIKDLHETIAAAYEKLDALINNAGAATKSGPGRAVAVEEIEEDNIDFSFGLFMKGPILLVKYFTPMLRQAQDPSVVNISSIAAITDGPNNVLYGVSKAGIDKFTRTMTCNLPGIRTNSILPGLIRTPIVASANDEATAEAIFEQSAKMVPCGRVGEPEDIASCILFICSPEASYINGASIVVDGGMSKASSF